MTVACPTCGASVEFRYDDSFVRVCEHCRSAVVRGDRGVETLGRFADLVPIDSPLRLFAEGRYGSAGFLLVGMAQLRHAAGGVWQEWYAKLDGGQWAWLSEAQGRLYLTFERSDLTAPSIAHLAPGAQVELAGAMYSVAERGAATYVSALGEIPYRLVPGSTFQFADLSDARGGFATVDYGDGSEPPVTYVGHVVTPQGLGISGGEAPQVVAPAGGQRLACPNCNGSLELRAPGETLRVLCPYCNTLVSVESGTLSIISRQASRPKPAIALGSTGTFEGRAQTVIGYVQRSAFLDGKWWPFHEYLLHAPGMGFRWLVCSDGHWSYVQPVATGAVTLDVHVAYDGVSFQRFQVAELRVDCVLGEFYWRVEAGERVRGEDYIAPPAMLSREVTATEQNWSLSSYLTPREVEHAFGKKLELERPTGVAPNQPYPSGIGKVAALAFAVLCAVGVAKCKSATGGEKLDQRFVVPMNAARPAAGPPLGSSLGKEIEEAIRMRRGSAGSAQASATASRAPAGSAAADGAAAGSGAADGSAAEATGTVLFSQKFPLDGGRNVAFALSANVRNSWVYAAIDLVNDDTGAVVSFDRSIEYYAGVDDGESWSEGSTTADEILGPVQAGNYVLRIEAQNGGLGDVDLGVVIRQGVFRGAWFWLAFGVLAIPFVLAGFHALAFRRRRWENSNVGARAGASHADEGDDDDDDD